MRKNPLANVYRPYRLKVKARCIAISGTVVSAGKTSDGDYKIHLRLDAGQARLLNANNDGTFVEVVPAEQPGC